MKKKKELSTEMVQIAQRNHYEWKRRKKRRLNLKPLAIALGATAAIAIGATTMALGSNEGTVPNTEPVAHEVPRNYYPLTTVVTEIDYAKDLVTIRTSSGLEYSFHGVEDWWPGDICSCLMDNNGTDIVTDDIILMKRYNGVPSNFAIS